MPSRKTSTSTQAFAIIDFKLDSFFLIEAESIFFFSYFYILLSEASSLKDARMDFFKMPLSENVAQLAK
jgi:hypothetical protein